MMQKLLDKVVLKFLSIDSPIQDGAIQANAESHLAQATTSHIELNSRCISSISYKFKEVVSLKNP